MPTESQEKLLEETVENHIPSIQDLYNEKYPGEGLHAGVTRPDDDFVYMEIINTRTDPISFSVSVHESDHYPDEFYVENTINLSKVKDLLYSENNGVERTVALNFKPSKQEINEEEQDLWYAFHLIGKEVIEPELALQHGFHERTYLFRQ